MSGIVVTSSNSVIVEAIDHSMQYPCSYAMDAIVRPDTVKVYFDDVKECWVRSAMTRGTIVNGWFVPDPGQLITYRICVDPSVLVKHEMIEGGL